MKYPIIDRARLPTLEHWTLSGFLTIVFWAFWIHLWLPLLALLAWSLGLKQAYKYMIELRGYAEVLALLGFYLLVVLLMGGVLVCWATYNILRSRRLSTRVANRPVTDEQIARYFRHGQQAVRSWQQAARLLVTHDEKGGIALVEILELKEPTARQPATTANA